MSIMRGNKLECTGPDGKCINIKAKVKSNGAGNNGKSIQEEFDENITDTYKLCDAKVPLLGGICDLFNTSTGLRKILVYLVGIPALGFVIFWDIFGDWITIVMTILADALDGVPVAGTIIGIMESPEFDDVIDFISLAIVFVFCGPVTFVGVVEFSEGILELFPFWTVIIIIWLVVINPARIRVLQRKNAAKVKKVPGNSLLPM
jgi:hypothetical protein